MYLNTETNELIVEEEDCTGGIPWYQIREWIFKNEKPGSPGLRSIRVPKFTHFYGVPVVEDQELGGVPMLIGLG